MPLKRPVVYKCSACGREVGHDNLRSKRVQFREMKDQKIIRSRVVAWLCIIPAPDGSTSCLDKDDDWKRPLYATAPGLQDTSIALDA